MCQHSVPEMPAQPIFISGSGGSDRNVSNWPSGTNIHSAHLESLRHDLTCSRTFS